MSPPLVKQIPPQDRSPFTRSSSSSSSHQKSEATDTYHTPVRVGETARQAMHYRCFASSPMRPTDPSFRIYFQKRQPFTWVFVMWRAAPEVVLHCPSKRRHCPLPPLFRAVSSCPSYLVPLYRAKMGMSTEFPLVLETRSGPTGFPLGGGASSRVSRSANSVSVR
ncbi:MAG: hypothetical protein HW414_606 [Dehalococcoidia bacterium]|nr:hypothetical protein [Dehalococcoidia bacterium]